MSEAHESYPDTYHDVYAKTMLGFWIYLLTDFVLFGVMFATYAVLHNSYFGGPTNHDIFNLNYALIETLVLLSTATTAGIGGNFVHRNRKKGTIVFFTFTFILGLLFLLMQFHEFSTIFKMNASWQTSAFLSAYFTLVGIFSIHMIFALTWVIVLIIPVFLQGVTEVSVKRLSCLRMFFQFLNLIWVFIFSMVYLLGGV